MCAAKLARARSIISPSSAIATAPLDNNGSFDDIPGDSIYHAELTAAQLFIEELNPAFHRVAVMTFNDSISVAHQLSNDFRAAYQACEDLKQDRQQDRPS